MSQTSTYLLLRGTVAKKLVRITLWLLETHDVCLLSFYSSVQLLSCVRLFETPWTATLRASLSITNSWSLLKLMSIKLVMLSNHLILCHPLLLPPSILHNIRVFSNESVLHIRWPKYGSFSISPSNEYSGLISFRIDWLDLLAVQGTLKSLLQYIKPTAFTISSKIRYKTSPLSPLLFNMKMAVQVILIW